MTSISATLEKMRLATPDNVMSTLTGSLSSEKRKWVALVYRWVRYAKEPLTIEALGHALAVSTSSEDVSFADIDYGQLSDDLEASFAGTIVIDGRDVKFSHESFHNALIAGVEELSDEQPSLVHGAVAKACLERNGDDDDSKVGGYVKTLKTLAAHRNPRLDLETRYSYQDGIGCHGYTALTFAVINGNYDRANFLLESGVKLVKFTKACLERGVNLCEVDKDGSTPLHGIRSTTPVSVIQVLIDAGALVGKVNAGLTPLAAAIEHHNFDAVKLR
ncbi:hypothetical protein QQS21_011551 [Conoideocrella luteorostrata]|uniref:Ankyrin n=1 Tax=Conoideocrella luteorostrata TaxID=1105319 RepID=A0AAJ0FVS4_9HYPO|nr:hypothetical protein QQS21_011551 [Conoideocrella luteorostrata]